MVAITCTAIASVTALYITERFVRLFRKPAPEPIAVPESIRQEAKPDLPPEEYVSPKQRRLDRTPHSELSFGSIRSEFSPTTGIRR